MVEDVGVGLFFFGVVLPMLLLNCVSFLSRAVPEKFSSCQVFVSCLDFSDPFSQANLWVWPYVYGLCEPST